MVDCKDHISKNKCSLSLLTLVAISSRATVEEEVEDQSRVRVSGDTAKSIMKITSLKTKTSNGNLDNLHRGRNCDQAVLSQTSDPSNMHSSTRLKLRAGGEDGDLVNPDSVNNPPDNTEERTRCTVLLMENRLTKLNTDLIHRHIESLYEENRRLKSTSSKLSDVTGTLHRVLIDSGKPTRSNGLDKNGSLFDSPTTVATTYDAPTTDPSPFTDVPVTKDHKAQLSSRKSKGNCKKIRGLDIMLVEVIDKHRDDSVQLYKLIAVNGEYSVLTSRIAEKRNANLDEMESANQLIYRAGGKQLASLDLTNLLINAEQDAFGQLEEELQQENERLKTALTELSRVMCLLHRAIVDLGGKLTPVSTLMKSDGLNDQRPYVDAPMTGATTADAPATPKKKEWIKLRHIMTPVDDPTMDDDDQQFGLGLSDILLTPSPMRNERQVDHASQGRQEQNDNPFANEIRGAIKKKKVRPKISPIHDPSKDDDKVGLGFNDIVLTSSAREKESKEIDADEVKLQRDSIGSGAVVNESTGTSTSTSSSGGGDEARDEKSEKIVEDERVDAICEVTTLEEVQITFASMINATNTNATPKAKATNTDATILRQRIWQIELENMAARTIQTNYRRHRAMTDILEMSMAVIVCQSVVRRFISVTHIRHLRKVILQKHIWQMESESMAARTIQTNYRRHRVMTDILELLMAVIVCQSVVRRYISVTHNRHVRKLKCATVIQATWRRYLVRKIEAPKSEESPANNSNDDDCIIFQTLDMMLVMTINKHRDDTFLLLQLSSAKGTTNVPSSKMTDRRNANFKAMASANQLIYRAGGQKLTHHDLKRLLAKAEQDAVSLFDKARPAPALW